MSDLVERAAKMVAKEDGYVSPNISHFAFARHLVAISGDDRARKAAIASLGLSKESAARIDRAVCHSPMQALRD